jgi:hypothetical protein
MMPLTAGARVSAQIRVLETILNISEGIRRREAIRSLPHQSQLDAWKSWFRDFDPGVRIGDDVAEFGERQQRFVEQHYDAWFLRQGQTVLRLPNPRVTLQRLIDLVNEVRNLNFRRLEFRACRIGTDPNALRTVARFFGARQVVAPKEVRTFYGVIQRVDIVADPVQFGRRIRSLGGPMTGPVHHRRRSIPTRILSDLVIPMGFRFVCVMHSVPSIAFEIGPNRFRVVALGEIWMRVFINKHISPGYTGSLRPFVIGGLEPAGQAVIAGKAHVFPLELEYKSLLALFDAASVTP